MTLHASRPASLGASDPVLNAMVDAVADALQAGRPVDLDAIAGRDPARAERLRDLLPAIAMMADLGRSIARDEPGMVVPVASGVLGDYRIVREVGRGGMGVVYEAEQVSLGRRVALKVLPADSAGDPKHLTRFHLEVQAAAHLHHAHIVPVYAVGCDRGLNYYAMQFIDGPSLAPVIRELRRRDGLEPIEVGPGTAPALAGDLGATRGRSYYRAVAHLGVQASEALDHAHRHGVVHRDVKPANLLADARGHLWVADFGLARLRDGGDLTLSGDLLGTIRYMSPEQAEGGRAPVDHRTDVYSLGATLYELLTLRPAFEGDDRRALLRRVVSEEPRPPRRVDPEVPRDLETIVLKAMAKEPAGRYATALGLADDLRRYLADEPIRARRPSPIGLAARWARRHRAATSAAGLAVALATLLGTALLWREKGKTEAALVEAREARRNEREALRFTFLASDRIASEALRKVAAPGTPAGPDADFCRKALAYYEEIARRYRDDPAMRQVAAAAFHRVGFIRMVMKVDGAEGAIRRSIALYDSDMSMTADLRGGLALALDDLGQLVRQTRGFAEAEPILRRSIEVRSGLADGPDGSKDALVSLVYRGLELAEGLERSGKPADAAEARRALGDRPGRAARAVPDDPRLLNNLAWLLVGSPLANRDEAAVAAGLAGRAVALDPKSRPAWNTLGAARFRLGDDGAAADAFAASTRLRDGGDPYDWLFLAMIAHRRGDHAGARSWLDRSLASIAGSPAADPDPDLLRLRDEAASLVGPLDIKK